MKNKKIYIIIGIIIIAIVAFIIIKNVNRGNSNTLKQTETIEFNQAFDIENVEKATISLSKSNKEKVASKYVLGNDIYVTDANVKLDDRDGKVIYLRSTYNKLNIYQTKYRIDELDYFQQIEKYIEKFAVTCSSQVGTLDEPTSKTIYGSAENNFSAPESIYNENKIYTLSYRVKDETYSSEDSTTNTYKEYEINFYRNDQYLMCEFVKIIQ